MFFTNGIAYANTICEIYVSEIDIDASPRNIDLDCRLKILNIAELRNQLRDGAKMIFSIDILIEELGTIMPNSDIIETQKSYHLYHEPLTREFYFVFDDKVIKNRDLNALFKESLIPLLISLTPEDELEDNENYRATLKFNLRHAEVPPWLERTLFFWSWDLANEISAVLDFSLE